MPSEHQTPKPLGRRVRFSTAIATFSQTPLNVMRSTFLIFLLTFVVARAAGVLVFRWRCCPSQKKLTYEHVMQAFHATSHMDTWMRRR